MKGKYQFLNQSHPSPAERVAWIYPPKGGKMQRHASALIGSGGTGCRAPGLRTPNQNYFKENFILVEI